MEGAVGLGGRGSLRTTHRCPFNCRRTSKPSESGKGWVNIAPTFSLSKEKQGNVPLQGPPIMTEWHWVGDRLLFITPSPNSSLSHYSWRVIEKFSPNSPDPDQLHSWLIFSSSHQHRWVPETMANAQFVTFRRSLGLWLWGWFPWGAWLTDRWCMWLSGKCFFSVRTFLNFLALFLPWLWLSWCS